MWIPGLLVLAFVFLFFGLTSLFWLTLLIFFAMLIFSRS